jgi:cobalt-zinc-cadmium efflux system protein
MAHDHQHDHGPEGANARRLAITLALVLVYMGVEVVGGLLADSLALIADAGHMFSDAGALGLTLFAMRFARRPATAQRTYGSYRAEILAALVNGATLVAVALYIFVEAFERIRTPPEVQGGLLLAVAFGGLLVNAAGLWILHTGNDANLNVRGAWLHVLTDALGSLQAIVAGALIWAYGWNWVDPLASLLIGLLVIYSSWSLIRQSVAVLMEGAPGHINVDEVRSALLDLPQVSNVHDLHVWTITSGFVALSAHVTCLGANHDALLRDARAMLAQRFGIRHTTIQIDRDPSCEGTDHPPFASSVSLAAERQIDGADADAP